MLEEVWLGLGVQISLLAALRHASMVSVVVGGASRWWFVVVVPVLWGSGELTRGRFFMFSFCVFLMFPSQLCCSVAELHTILD